MKQNRVTALFITYCILLWLITSCKTVRDKRVSSFDIIECDTSVNCSFTYRNMVYKANSLYKFKLKTTVDHTRFRYKLPEFADSSNNDVFLILKILPGCFFDQTKVKYEYVMNDSVFHWEVTGLIEDKKSIWIHPPRSLISDFEFSPFFEIQHNKSGWKSKSLFFNNNDDKITDENRIWVKHSYEKLGGDSVLLHNNNSFLCKKININSQFKEQTYHSEMLFNDSLGFVQIDITLINGESYSLELIEYDSDYCR